MCNCSFACLRNIKTPAPAGIPVPAGALRFSIKTIPVGPKEPLHSPPQGGVVRLGQVGVLGQQLSGGGLGLVEQDHVPLQAGQL